jgi:hypothetical protein
MSQFKIIIQAPEEELLQTFHEFRKLKSDRADRLDEIAMALKTRKAQIICAVGFNSSATGLPEVYPILGFDSFDDLVKERNDIFTTDIYKYLTLDNILTIYDIIRDNPEILQVMQYLLKKRLEKIESRIEATVNSMIIEKYKAEMRAIYNDGIANIEFAEERLNMKDSGFRALLNEVCIIIESKIIPAGDIFFRDTILPQEKHKILSRGLMPRALIQARLEDENTSLEEKKILYDYLKQNRE